MDELLLQHIGHRLQDTSAEPLLSLPETLLRLHTICRSDVGDVYHIESEVTGDPGFTSYLLQLSNSALYGTGKLPCTSTVNAVRRIGIHAVGEMAMVYALRGLHRIRHASPPLLTLLEHNWQRSWNLAQNATRLYWQHEQRQRHVDVSDILTSGILYFSGVLACYTAYHELVQQYQDTLTPPDKQLEQQALALNTRFLPTLLAKWGYNTYDSAAMLSGLASTEPLHYSDYLHSALARCGEVIPQTEPLRQRLQSLQLLPDEL